jgi:putative membrane protein
MAPQSHLFWFPYCGSAPAPTEWLSRWNLDPPLIAAQATGLAASLLLGKPPSKRWAIAAVAVLAVTFVSPLCALGSALFSARAVHHLLLIGVAAPLLAWSLPVRRCGPLALATLVQAATLWAWHAPAAYGWALSHDAAYWLMQLSLLGSALWFWTALRQASAPAAVGGLLIAMVAMGLLGALITLAGQPLYAPHLATTAAWGLSALEDQQVAGLIMWAPGSAIYLAAALAILGRWIGPGRCAEVPSA